MIQVSPDKARPTALTGASITEDDIFIYPHSEVQIELNPEDVVINIATIEIETWRRSHPLEYAPLTEPMKSAQINYERKYRSRRIHYSLYLYRARRIGSDRSRQPRDKGHEKNWRRKFVATKHIFNITLN